MKSHKLSSGFTLIEMMVVLGIIAILLTISIPSFEYRTVRSQINESVELVKTLKESVNLFYLLEKKFPRNNLEAGIPKPEFLIGNYVERIDLENGAFHITFGNKLSGNLKNKVLSIRPIVVVESPESPISWVCGNESVPAGMVAVGANKTDITNNYLPISCF